MLWNKHFSRSQYLLRTRVRSIVSFTLGRLVVVIYISSLHCNIYIIYALWYIYHLCITYNLIVYTYLLLWYISRTLVSSIISFTLGRPITINIFVVCTVSNNRIVSNIHICMAIHIWIPDFCAQHPATHPRNTNPKECIFSIYS